MNTSITTKFAALALALMVNNVLMGSVAYLFNARLDNTAAVSVAAIQASPSNRAA